MNFPLLSVFLALKEASSDTVVYVENTALDMSPDSKAILRAEYVLRTGHQIYTVKINGLFHTPTFLADVEAYLIDEASMAFCLNRKRIRLENGRGPT